MATRNVIFNEDEGLRKKSREVTKFDEKLHQLLDDMAETMYQMDGVGLAAPQVGILRRAMIVDVGEGLIECVNPEIISQRGTQTDNEGCLSFPGISGTVTRPMKVKVRAFDRHGNEFTVRGEKLLARALCHEIDHLNGVLFVDLSDDVGPDERKREKSDEK